MVLQLSKEEWSFSKEGLKALSAQIWMQNSVRFSSETLTPQAQEFAYITLRSQVTVPDPNEFTLPQFTPGGQQAECERVKDESV